jgi:hypothetical protein
MSTSSKHIRTLVAVGLAIGLVAAACGGSSGPLGGNGGNGGNAANGGGQALTAGLSSNLDSLDSYQFSWTTSAVGSTATSVDTGSFAVSGTVVNKPTKSYKINDLGALQIIVIGDQGWTSYDNGTTWTPSTDYSGSSSGLSGLLPTSLYGADFDTYAGDMAVKGDETKNGVNCVHYQSNSNTGAAGALLGVNVNVTADLWVAKDWPCPGLTDIQYRPNRPGRDVHHGGHGTAASTEKVVPRRVQGPSH